MKGTGLGLLEFCRFSAVSLDEFGESGRISMEEAGDFRGCGDVRDEGV